MLSVFEQTNQLTTLNNIPGQGPCWSKCADYKAEIVMGRCKFQFYQAYPGYSYTTGYCPTQGYTPWFGPPPPEKCIRHKSQADIDMDRENIIEQMKEEARYTGMPFEEEEEEEPDFWEFIRSLREKIGDDCIDPEQSYFISAFDFH